MVLQIFIKLDKSVERTYSNYLLYHLPPSKLEIESTKHEALFLKIPQSTQNQRN